MKKVLLPLLFILFANAAFAQELFDMPHATGTYLSGINDSGEICGYYTLASGNTLAFMINKYGDTINLTGPGGSNAYVNSTGISNNGMVVGNYGASSASANSFIYLPGATRFAAGTYYAVPVWGGTNTQASGITNDTCIAGSYDVGPDKDGALWCKSAGVETALRCLDHSTVVPAIGCDLDINNNVCGYIIEGAEEQCFIYRGVTLGWDTFQIGGYTKSKALGMNDNGWICGNYNNSTKGFYCQKLAGHNYSNLSTITVIGATSIYPSHINNKNEIVGYYTDAQDVDHGFIIAKYDIGFKPSVNGYTFVNSQPGVYPVAYTNNFNYTTDPYLKNGAAFQPDPNNFDWVTDVFPNWPDFVKCMVESGFYTLTHGVKKINQGGFASWSASACRGKFLGNCFGMSNTSLQIYDNPAWYLQLFPLSARYSGIPVHSYPLVDTVLTAICQTQFKQWSKLYGAHQANHQPDKLLKTMQALKQSLRNSRGRPHSVLIMNIQNTGGSHAVVPYKLVPGYQGNGIDTVYIYDSNFPSQDNLFLTVDQNEGGAGVGHYHYTANGQLADWGAGLTGNGIWMRGVDTMDLAPQKILSIYDGGPIVARNNNQLLYAYFNDHSNVNLTDDADSVSTISVDSGSSTGYILPMRNFTGFGGVESPGMFSTSNVTTVNKHTQTGYTNNYLMLDEESDHLICHRISGADTTDDYQFSPGSITYINNGTGVHGIAYTLNAEDSAGASEYNYYISGLSVPAGNKASANTYGVNGMQVLNYGPATTYVITTQFITPDSVKIFTDTIAIQHNTTHTILPHDTTYSGIYILVDTGMTGVIVDSIFIHQTIAGINSITAPNITAWPVPTSNQLFMSGPTGKVAYTIIDALGRTVATGELDFGNGTTQKFNVARFAPGVYTIIATGPQSKWTYKFVKE